MRISIVTPVSQNVEPYIPIFESRGVKVDKNYLHPDCDAIIGTGLDRDWETIEILI